MTVALRNVALVATLLLGSAAGIELVQPSLAFNTHKVKLRDDVYKFPPADELRVMSLGYRSAVADILWAMLLVEYGTHWQEKREWTDAPRYMDGILALEPTHPLVYRFADTIIVYRPLRGTEADARVARQFLERGIRELPWDHDVWLHYGQFIAFTAGAFLSSQDEINLWRKDGALAIARAVELGADADRSTTAATILGKSGERAAGIRQLRRAYALTDDPRKREEIANKLIILEARAEQEATEKDIRFIESRWQKDFGFLARDLYLLLGPVGDPAACAGRDSTKPVEALRCPRNWDEALPSYARANGPSVK